MSVYKLALWDLTGRTANYLIVFASSVVLARLLQPEEFGVFGLLLAFTTVSAIFLDFGFRMAVVQAPEISSLQLTSVFTINLGLGAAIFLIVFLLSGLLESAYSIPGLSTYLNVLSSTFIFNAVAAVPLGLLQRDLRIRTLSVISLIAAIFGGSISILMALKSFGVWSLVISNVVSSIIMMAGCFVFSRWVPTSGFSFSSVKPLWQFGSRMFGSTVLETVFTRADAFLIPQLFGVSSLGYYTRAQAIDSLVRTFSATSIVSVMFPVFARNQTDSSLLRDLYLRSLNMISFVAFAISGTLAVVAVDLVVVLFSSRWLESASYYQIMAITAFVFPTSALMVNLIAARGNSKAFLILELVKKGLILPTYLFLVLSGVSEFLIAMGVAYLGCLGLNMLYVKREIGSSISEQIGILFQYLLFATIAALAAVVTLYFLESHYLRLLVGSSVFIGAYGLLNFAFRTRAADEILSKGRSMINDKRNANISPAS